MDERGGTVSQNAVERTLGKLVTDDEFCARFFENPAAATWEAGLPLSALELEALSGLSRAAIARFSQSLDGRAEHFGDPSSGGEMSLRVHVGRDRRDRESSDHPIDTLEREHEAGRQIGPLHIRDRRDRPAASRNEQQSIVRNHLADVRREFLDEPTCVGLAPHRPSQSHGGGLELDQVPVSRCDYTNHPACPDASRTPNDAQPPLAVTDPFFRRRSPADAVRFRRRSHGNAQHPCDCAQRAT